MTHNTLGFAKQQRMIALLGLLALVFGSLALHTLPVAQAATTVTVTPNTPNGWTFDNDGSTGGLGEFVVGPGTPPLGTGSVRFLLDNTSTSRKIIFNTGFDSTRLDALTKLEYDSYRSSIDNSNVQAVALQFDMDFDLSDTTTNFQGRLIYEPYLSGGSVPQNTWQSWNALAGKWWASRAPYNNPKASVPPGCPMNDPCTLAEVL